MKRVDDGRLTSRPAPAREHLMSRHRTRQRWPRAPRRALTAGGCRAWRAWCALATVAFVCGIVGCDRADRREATVHAPAGAATAGARAANVDQKTTIVREFVDPASDVTIVLTAWPRSVRTIDALNLRIVIDRPAGIELTGSMRDLVQRALPEGWEVMTAAREVSSPPSSVASAAVSIDGGAEPQDDTQEIHTLSISPFVPGEIEIGPLALEFRAGTASGAVAAPLSSGRGEVQPNEGVITLEVSPFTVRVVSALNEVDPSDPDAAATGALATAGAPADLRDPVEAPPTPIPAWFWWALGGGTAGLVLLAAAAVWLAVRASRREPKEVIRHRTAEEIAFSALNRLAASKLIDQPNGAERFVDRASNILRQYVEDRYGLRAPELTTEEFLDEARHSRAFEPGDLVLFERFLTTTDLIKFAAAGTSRSEAEEAGALVRAFVERTKFDTQGRATVIMFNTDGHRVGRIAPNERKPTSPSDHPTVVTPSSAAGTGASRDDGPAIATSSTNAGAGSSSNGNSGEEAPRDVQV